MSRDFNLLDALSDPSSVVDAVRENPVPVALAALVLGVAVGGSLYVSRHGGTSAAHRLIHALPGAPGESDLSRLSHAASEVATSSYGGYKVGATIGEGFQHAADAPTRAAAVLGLLAMIVSALLGAFRKD